METAGLGLFLQRQKSSLAGASGAADGGLAVAWRVAGYLKAQRP